MRRATAWIGGLLWTLGCGVGVGGCADGSGGSGGGSTTPTPTQLAADAINATLPALSAELRAGTATLTSSLTVGTVANPLAVPAAFSRTLALGARANDGSTTSVRVDGSGQRSAGGTESFALTVTDTVTQTVQLDLLFNVTRVDVAYRTPPLGLSDLAADGSGQAFVVMSYTFEGDLRREFENGRGGRTLIDFGGFSPPQATVVQTASLRGVLEYVVEYRLTRGASGSTAQVVALSPSSQALVFTRAGGAGGSPVQQAFDALTLDGLSTLGAGDPVGVVGADMTAGASATAAAAVLVDVRFAGGIQGGLFRTRITGPLAPALPDTAGFAALHTAALSGLGGVSDGRVQVDQALRIRTRSDESPGASPLDHGLDGQLGPASPTFAFLLEELERVIYLPGLAFREQAVILYR